MKVYVIEKGEYSDRHVVAVASCEERAEELCKLHSDTYDKAYYSEFELDTANIDRDILVIVWRIIISKDGEVKEASYYFSDETYVPTVWFDKLDGSFWAHFPCYTTDKDEAIKIAFDKRAKLMCEQEEA